MQFTKYVTPNINRIAMHIIETMKQLHLKGIVGFKTSINNLE